MDAGELLRKLVGQTILTITGQPNRVLSIQGDAVIVGTLKSELGEPVPIEWVQNALDRLHAEREIEINPDSVGYRSAFIGAVLLTLPNSQAERRPARVMLVDAEHAWDIEPGDSLRRRDLHARYGGGSQGGIAPSRRSPSVLIFTNPKVGHTYGYNYDGWSRDGTYRYTGEGQIGDQQLRAGNKAILEHHEQGRSLRLFQSVGPQVTYLGEFEVDEMTPFLRADAPEVNNGPLRSVFVFRLRPVGEVVKLEGTEISTTTTGAMEVPVEQQSVESFKRRSPEEQSAEGVRREGALVRRYQTWLEGKDHQVCRNRMIPPGEVEPLYTDLFDKSTGELIEAKGTTSRPAVRMAIGQLADYSRFIELSSSAVLLPSEPRADLMALLLDLNIECIWEAGEDWFERRPSG